MAVPLRREAIRLCLEACRLDDVSLINQALSLTTSSSDSRLTDEILHKALDSCIAHNAAQVLRFLIERGVSVRELAVARSGHIPSCLILDILLAQGWDINFHTKRDLPFLWHVLGDASLVSWCLDRGASTVPTSQSNALPEPQSRRRAIPPITETAAAEGTVATFDLLRSHGAPLGQRALHMAAEAASRSIAHRTSTTTTSASHSDATPQQPQASAPAQDPAQTLVDRLAMVAHLLDDLGLNSNAPDQPPGWMLGNHWGRPLHYVVHAGGRGCKMVTWLLLDRGADPDLPSSDHEGGSALDLAAQDHGNGVFNPVFIEAVSSWRSRNAGTSDRRLTIEELVEDL